MILHKTPNSFTVDSNSKFDFLGCSVHVLHDVVCRLIFLYQGGVNARTGQAWIEGIQEVQVPGSGNRAGSTWTYETMSHWVLGHQKKQNRELGEFNLFLIWFLVCNVMTSRFRGSNFIYLQSCFGKLCHSQHFLLPSLVLWESKSIEFCHSIGARAPTNERTSWGNSSSTGAWVKSRNLFGTKRMTSLSWGPQKADCFG